MKGFVLLEVLVSVLMSSFIFMSLAAGLFQLSKGLQMVDNIIDASQRASTLYTLLERDFIGTTIPVQAAVAQQKKGKEGEKKPATQDSKLSETPAPVTDETSQKKEKPVTHIFYSALEKSNANLISCITTDPVPVYWSERAGKAKPRIARVTYRLKPDTAIENVESFVLTRQEGAQLDFDAYAKSEGPLPSEHVVISGVKSFRVNYGYIEEKEEEQKAPVPKGAPAEAAPINKDQKRDYKLKNEWPEPLKEESSAQNKEKLPLIPSYADISLILWDPLHKKEQDFSFVINFVSSEEQLETQAALRFIVEKPAAPAKPATPSAPGAAGGGILKPVAGMQAQTAPDQTAPAQPSHEAPSGDQEHGKMMTVDELMHMVGDQEDGAPRTEVIAKIKSVDEHGQRYTVFEGPIKITSEMLGALS